MNLFAEIKTVVLEAVARLGAGDPLGLLRRVGEIHGLSSLPRP